MTPTAPRAERPLVSCVMVTAGRAEYVRQAIRYYREQDYEARELIIVYEQDTDLPEPLPTAPRLRAVRVAQGMSLGQKRNEGTRLARGELVAQWDDDDWYSRNRLSRQVAPLLAGEADITALRGALFLDVASFTFWECTPQVHARMFVEDVLGGTLVFRRALWGDQVMYPDARVREDADFLVAAMRLRAARLARLPARDVFIYVRHGGNTWRFNPGRMIDPSGWRKAREPSSFAADRHHYLRPGAPVDPGARPLVSCIMPTHDRRRFVPRALRYFRRQTSPNLELLIVDDGTEPVEDLVPRDERIHYIHLPRRASIGAKRNLACERAKGEFIVHWDDDDWYAPGWVEAQVEFLTRTGADACGLDRPYFYDPVRSRAFRYEYPRDAPPWVHGATLCYTRALWCRNPFPDTSQGEDTRFLWSPVSKQVLAHEHTDKYVAYIHAGNVSPKLCSGARWTPCSVPEVKRLRVGASERVR